MNEANLENRVSKLEERYFVMDKNLALNNQMLEQTIETLKEVKNVLQKVVDDQNLNISQWIKKHFITLLLAGGLALYMLGIIKP